MSQKVHSAIRHSEEKISHILNHITPQKNSNAQNIPAAKSWGSQTIVLDYPVNSTPRYGYGKPPLYAISEVIEKNTPQYMTILDGFLQFKQKLLTIPTRNQADSTVPCWINGFIPGLDAVALYSLMAMIKPQRYFEIGSGNSTKFVHKSIADNGLSTSVTSIDPQPRANISAICDRIIQKPVEDVDLSVFDELQENDVLFVDDSHRCFMNSDVTVVFLEILPRLKSGVYIHFHDITLPWDYPSNYIERYYSEQYLLAVLLLAKNLDYEVVLPNWYLSQNSQFKQILNPLWLNSAMENVETHGCSFWMKKK